MATRHTARCSGAIFVTFLRRAVFVAISILSVTIVIATLVGGVTLIYPIIANSGPAVAGRTSWLIEVGGNLRATIEPPAGSQFVHFRAVRSWPITLESWTTVDTAVKDRRIAYTLSIFTLPFVMILLCVDTILILIGVIAFRQSYYCGFCDRCGYDARGNISERCPECGAITRKPVPPENSIPGKVKARGRKRG